MELKGKTAIVTGSAGSTLAALEDPIAKYYIYAMMRNILDKVTKATDAASTIYHTRATASLASCQYTVIEKGVDLLRGGRKSGQVEIGPSNQSAPARRRFSQRALSTGR